MSNGHDDFEALLPWYATGRLDAETRRRIDAALKARADLATLLALAEEDREATAALNESLGMPGAAVWERIAAVAASEPVNAPLGSRLAEFVGLGAAPNRRRLAWIAAAAALVIVVEAGALVALAPVEVARNGSGPYATASAPAPVAAGPRALVAFAPEASIDQIGALLAERHATIVDGPRSGFYTVRFGDKALSADATKALIESLRADPLIKMALPTGG